jgi:hypothetical protein
LLRKYADRLKQIPREYMPCDVVLKKTAREGLCEVEGGTAKSFAELAEDLARDYGVKTDSATLAKVNGRDESESVSRQDMKILLAPEPVPVN